MVLPALDLRPTQPATLTLPAPVTRPLLGVGQGGEVRRGLGFPGVMGPGCPRETGTPFEPRLQVPDTRFTVQLDFTYKIQIQKYS